MNNQAIKIEYGNLYVSEYGEGGEIKLPLNDLPQMEEADAEHIHGFLRITIGDEKIKRLRSNLNEAFSDYKNSEV